MRWLTALWVRFNSAAASVKLRCRAATAKMRNASKEGVRSISLTRAAKISLVVKRAA
jgi:hypothetical protein